MIYRPWEGGWLLITQPAHAWLAGELAARWGHGDFLPPSPPRAVVLAARLHDIGWAVWDRKPRLGEDGRPVNFIGTTLDETLPIWRTAVAQVSTFDPYAALLVSMHGATIYRRRLERGTDPEEARPQAEAELARLEIEQEAQRARLAENPEYRQAAAPEKAARAYRWLRICDLLSLALCSDVLPAEGEIANIPSKNGEGFTTLHYRIPRPFSMELSPRPFADSVIHLAIQARFLKGMSFQSQSAFDEALENAAWAPQEVFIS